MKKLAVVATHPVQYHASIWRRLAAEGGLGIHVFYGSDFSVAGYTDSGFGVTVKWDVPLTEGYEHTFLRRGGTWDDRPLTRMRPHGLEERLRAFAPHALLLTGYGIPFHRETFLIARRLALPVIVRSEANDETADRSFPKRFFRDLLIRAVYRRCAYFLAIGERARAHYERHGVSPHLIGFSPYTTDSDRVEGQYNALAPRRSSIRSALGFSEEDTVFLFAGKLIPRKDPMTLAHALCGLPDNLRHSTGLIVMGDGPLRSELESLCRTALGERAVFAGFVNQNGIGEFYTAADCLVLPSLAETWGLVVNEALQFGVPAIVSSRVGCAPDLVIPGKTGFTFPAGRVAGLRQRLEDAWALLRNAREETREACRRKAAEYSVERAVAGICEAVDRVVR
ncbi:MAG: glycosyltransferase family 4 protein [Bacteroidota bacterium]|nr:glycosyltransferase family 4 protein [Bacteroidota bacterium]